MRGRAVVGAAVAGAIVAVLGVTAADARLPERTELPPTVFGLSARDADALAVAERRLGLVAGVVGVFADWTEPFPLSAVELARDRGAALLISWEPHDSELHRADQPRFALRRITSGSFDRYIVRWAGAAAAADVPLYVRWAPEMNGDWLAWSTGVNGNRAGDYVRAWRHVVSVARRAGARDVRWVFNPIASYEGSTPLRSLWPGSAYVDWVALDGYNWGATRPWGWQSFSDVFAGGLAEVRSVAPDPPLMVAEIGCAPGPGDKAAWVRDSLGAARAAGARMVVWFEHDKETDWRLSSDVEVARVAREVVAGSTAWSTGSVVSER